MKRGRMQLAVLNIHKFMMKEAQEAKGQVPSENPLKLQKSMEEKTKFLEGN